MSEQVDKIFADGFSFKRNEKAPEFVVGRLSMKVDDAVAFMRENEKGGWVNVNIKKARSGNFYVELDTYEPTGGQEPSQPVKAPAPTPTPEPQEEEAEDLPF